MTFSKLARSAPPRLSDARPTEPGLLCLWKAHHSGEDGLPNDVRLTPESGHVQCNYGCPLWANSGHLLEAQTSYGKEEPRSRYMPRRGASSSNFLSSWE